MVKNRCKNHVKVAADFREGHHYALARFACDIMQGSCHDPITKKIKTHQTSLKFLRAVRAPIKFTL
jgi:hypothetical protein